MPNTRIRTVNCVLTRVFSGIPWYGIPPEFYGIFFWNSAEIKLWNSVFRNMSSVKLEFFFDGKMDTSFTQIVFTDPKSVSLKINFIYL